MDAQQTAVTSSRSFGSRFWKTLGVSALIAIGLTVALRWHGSREFHTKREFFMVRGLYYDVLRIVNSDVRSDSTPTLTAAEISTIEDVWSVIKAENLGHDRCTECDCRMMINPDLAAWRALIHDSDLAVVCVLKGRSRHKGVDFVGTKIEVETDRLPAWAKY